MSVARVCPAAASPNFSSLPLPVQRAVVADDSATILHAVCSLLEHHQVVEIVGRAESGPEAIERVKELQPDLVLLDADMPGMSGLRTALLLSQVRPEIRIILMSMDTSAQFRTACAGCGASAIIYKPRFLKELRALLQSPGQPAGALMGVAAVAAQGRRSL